MSTELPRMESRRTIWKFTIDAWSPHTEMPKGARILCAREQDNQLRVWAEVDPDAPVVGHRFGLGMTGGYVPAGDYIGTAFIDETPQGGAQIVVHLYDLGEMA